MSEAGKESQGDLGGESRGARPIRMKGYWRAVKRGEAWALKIHQMPEGFAKCLALLYRATDWKRAVDNDWNYLKSLKKEDYFNNRWVFVPGKYFGEKE